MISRYRDRPGRWRRRATLQKLVRTTLIAAGLCCLPAAFACGLLIFASKQLFAFSTRVGGDRAANRHAYSGGDAVGQSRANGRAIAVAACRVFREISRICAGVAVAMALATAIAVVAKLTIVEFLGVYAAVYTAGALYLAVAAYREPILAAASPHGAAIWKRAAEPAAVR